MKCYHKANKDVQRQLQKDKKDWLERQCAEVEAGLEQNNLKKAYEVVKKLRKVFTPRQRNIKDKE